MTGLAVPIKSSGARTRRGRIPAEPVEAIWKTEVLGIWKFIRTQPPSFWLINLYLFFEYVRPQSVYTSIDILPWAQMTILASLGAILIEGRIPQLVHGLSKLYLVFIGIVLLSGLTAYRPAITWDSVELPLSWFLIFILITNIINTERRLFVFILAYLLYSAKMAQHGVRSWAGIGFGFRDWGAVGGPGWFHNSGEFGIQMCVFFPLAIYFIVALKPFWPTWKTVLFVGMPFSAVMSMVGSSSRGALVGGALVLAWIVGRSRYRVRAGVLALVVGVATFAVIPEDQRTRLSTMGEDGTSVSRLTMWEDGIEIANQHPILGIGYENWIAYYSRNYGVAQVPHNPFIEAGAELGYLGFFAFVALIVGTFVTNRRSRRLAARLGDRGRFLYFMGWGLDGALVGYLGSGFFVTVLHYPYFWINLSMTVALSLATRAKANEMVKERRIQAARSARVSSHPGSVGTPSMQPVHSQ